jgi:hypothetical protein
MDGTMKVLVAATLAAYKCGPHRDPMESNAWLCTIEAWRAQGYDLQVLAVLQVGQGHDDWFEPLRNQLAHLGAEVWTFSVDDGAEAIGSHSRIPSICMGRNLAHEYVATHSDITHLLLLDSDVEPPEDGLTKLLEVDHPIVGGCVPTYGLDGPQLFCGTRRFPEALGNSYAADLPRWGIFREEPGQPRPVLVGDVPRQPFPSDALVREHWNTAGCLLMRRGAALGLRWGWDPDRGMTDDPWFQDRAVALGFGQTWVRHDSLWHHHPPVIVPVERRGHDLSIFR